MTKDEARLLFPEYMYGELDANTEKELLKFISGYPDLEQELKELTETRQILSFMPESEQPVLPLWPDLYNKPRRGYDFLHSLLSVFTPKSAFVRYSLALTMAVMMLMVTAFLTDFSIRKDASGFTLAFGKQQTSAEKINADDLQQAINQIRQENLVIIERVLQGVQEQQNVQFQQGLLDLAGYMEERRMSDLQSVGAGLSSLQKSTMEKFQQTDFMLDRISQTLIRNNK